MDEFLVLGTIEIPENSLAYKYINELSREDKIHAIELGCLLLKTGNKEYQRIVKGENKEQQNRIREEYETQLALSQDRIHILKEHMHTIKSVKARELSEARDEIKQQQQRHPQEQDTIDFEGI